jgi:HD-GYP domain-containing protein (c-di-GMP phosphodiesterase class II)
MYRSIHRTVLVRLALAWLILSVVLGAIVFYLEIEKGNALILTVVVILITSISLYPVIIFLNRGLFRLSSALLKSNVELMEVLGSAVAKRDADTHVHNYRVTIYAIRLAEALGLSQHDIRRLMTGAFLHDVGKIGIADAILRKPDSLTDDEFGLLRIDRKSVV